MDGPQIGRWVSESSGWLPKLLCRWEADCYSMIMSPEVLFILKLPPETAVARKQDEGANYVRERSREVWNLDTTGLQYVPIDARLPAVEVAKSIRDAVWQRI
jgi:hypothetical protein